MGGDPMTGDHPRMRFRHALVLLLAVASLLLTAAAPSTGTATPAVVATRSAAATSSADTGTVDARARAEQAIVAMTSAGARTGSAVVVAPGLVVTSLHVMKLDRAGTTRIMTVEGGFAEFKEVSRDKRLGLVLLRVDGLAAKPVVWGKGRDLVADQPVTAIGIGSQGRTRILEQPGIMKSPAAATGNDLMITDIRIDPLVEGGALMQADGRIAGIVVAKSQGDFSGGEVGWAVTSEAVQEFVKSVQVKQQEDASRTARRTIMRVIAWGVLLAIVGLMTLAGRTFRRWYKRMEAREEAAMAAEEAARADREASAAED